MAISRVQTRRLDRGVGPAGSKTRPRAWNGYFKDSSQGRGIGESGGFANGLRALGRGATGRCGTGPAAGSGATEVPKLLEAASTIRRRAVS